MGWKKSLGGNLVACVGERGEQSFYKAGRASGGGGRGGREEPGVVRGFYGVWLRGIGGQNEGMTAGVREERTGGTGDSRGQKKGPGGGRRREDTGPWGSNRGEWGVVGDSGDQNGGSGGEGHRGEERGFGGQIEETGKGGGL